MPRKCASTPTSKTEDSCVLHAFTSSKLVPKTEQCCIRRHSSQKPTVTAMRGSRSTTRAARAQREDPVGLASAFLCLPQRSWSGSQQSEGSLLAQRARLLAQLSPVSAEKAMAPVHGDSQKDRPCGNETLNSPSPKYCSNHSTTLNVDSGDAR